MGMIIGTALAVIEAWNPKVFFTGFIILCTYCIVSFFIREDKTTMMLEWYYSVFMIIGVMLGSHSGNMLYKKVFGSGNK